MHEVFGHTADVGIRARAPTRDGLFAAAAEGLFAVILENPEAVRAAETRRVQVEAADPADLLHDFLSELLFLFEAEGLVLARFDVATRDGRLDATVWGEPLDRARHRLGPEVKAVTYHQLAVTEDEDGFTAEVILDV